MSKEAVHKLVTSQDIEEFQDILHSSDALKDYRDEEGNNILHLAASEGHAVVVKHLLESHDCENLMKEKDSRGLTPVDIALKRSEGDVFETFVSHGADLSHTIDGESLIVYSSVSAKVSCVKSLLAAGADPNSKTKDGLPLLFFLAALIAMKHQSDATIASEYQKIIHILLEAGASPNVSGPGGFTPLHVAGEIGNLELITTLIDNGASRDARNIEQKTPADIAAEWEHLEAVKHLLYGREVISTDSKLVLDSAKDLIQRRKKIVEDASKQINSGKTSSVDLVPVPEDPSDDKYIECKQFGNKLFVAGDFEAALAHYQQGLRHKTDDSVLWSNAAAAALRLDDFKEAIKHARIARVVDKNNVKAWYREGQAAEKLCLWEDAASAYYEAFLVNNESKNKISGIDFAQLVKDTVDKGRQEAVMPTIRPLSEKVVNKIAAGEVIQRPCNAVKELLENSLDAGATNISIHVKDGGLKLLQIQDDGCGIEKEDLPILCQRHTTSKLVEYEDLQHLNTLGFRGEALASLSYVSHVTVTTKKVEDTHAWKAIYDHGDIVEGYPTPSAGVDGTTVTIDDLFFNVPMRKKAIRSISEEYNNVVDIVKKYAVYHAGISVSLRKVGHSRPDIQTKKGSSRKDSIRHAYGPDIASNLRAFANDKFMINEQSQLIHIDGCLTGPNYCDGRRTVMILFINGRCVESASLRKCIESVYTVLLPKLAKPFIFISITMPSEWTDVNVHPTKSEVAFLHEDDICEEIRRLAQETLLDEERHRSYVQTFLNPNSSMDTRPGSSSKSGSDYKRPDRMVRTDAKTQTLEEAFVRASQTNSLIPIRHKRTRGGAVFDSSICDIDLLSDRALTTSPKRARERQNFDSQGNVHESPVNTAWESIASDIHRDIHEGVREILKDPVVVGIVDSRRILLQKGTRLYLVDMSELTRDLFFQLCIFRRGKNQRFYINPPLSSASLVLCALEAEEILGKWVDSPTSGTKSEVASLLSDLLVKKASFLETQFGIIINTSGDLVALPELVQGRTFKREHLPRFLLSLGQHVEWSGSIRTCLEGVAQTIAELYMIRPTFNDGEFDEEALRSVVKTFLPEMRTHLHPGTHRSTDGSIIELTRLEQLYRVFERC